MTTSSPHWSPPPAPRSEPAGDQAARAALADVFGVAVTSAEHTGGWGVPAAGDPVGGEHRGTGAAGV